jgi:hypothetical protein
VPQRKTPGSPYSGWYEKYRKGRKVDSRTMNKIFRLPVRVSVSMERDLHLKLVRFSAQEWVTYSALVVAALTEFLAKHTGE